MDDGSRDEGIQPHNAGIQRPKQNNQRGGYARATKNVGEPAVQVASINRFQSLLSTGAENQKYRSCCGGYGMELALVVNRPISFADRRVQGKWACIV